jgi:hypothetical protein
MSLVEASIILMVIAALTAVIAPAMSDYTTDARHTAAKEDVEAIGTGILQLLRDTNSRCLRIDGAVGCTKANRVDLLVSGGNNPRSVTAADVTLPDSDAATSGVVNWLPDPQVPAQQDTVDEQLIFNSTTPYTSVDFTARKKLGWRGAYLNGLVSGDPWSRKYQVNTLFLAVATDATDASPLQEGLRESGWSRDVLVVSAGINGVVETSFGGATAAEGVLVGGDDIAYNLGGTTR